MIAGIVLAAGTSARLGRPKQLLLLHGEPLLRHTVRAILASQLDVVLVVLGHEADAVQAAIAGLPVRVVLNPDFALGQSASVRAGLDALPPHTEAAVFLLGDQPGIVAETIDALIFTWRETNALIVAPQYIDGIGNPVLFDRRVFLELMSLAGDRGARAVVKTYQNRGLLEIVAIDDPMPPDVDTESDYAALLAATESPSPRARGDSPLQWRGARGGAGLG